MLGAWREPEAGNGVGKEALPGDLGDVGEIDCAISLFSLQMSLHARSFHGGHRRKTAGVIRSILPFLRRERGEANGFRNHPWMLVTLRVSKIPLYIDVAGEGSQTKCRQVELLWVSEGEYEVVF